jgi:hypothetical protein
MGVSRSSGKSQQEGQEDDVEGKGLEQTIPAAFRVPWFSEPSFWLFSGLPDVLWNFPHAIYS